MKSKIGPLNDFIFKKLFGTIGNEQILKSFLNAIFSDKNLPIIEEITIIENRELVQEFFEDKLGIIDLHAKTNKGEIINIEVQLWNEYNIVKRTLFYWSKLYSTQIKKGDNYKQLPKVITINILDFNYFNKEWVHLFFKPTADIDSTLTLEELEIHFIQLPAFRKKHQKNFKTHELERWLTLLTQTVDDNEMEELMTIDKYISKAYEQIKHLLSDDEIIAIAEARERQRLDYNNAIEGARDEGIEIAKIKNAKALLDILDDETISLKIELPLETVQKLRKDLLT